MMPSDLPIRGENAHRKATLELDFLIVGAGPAGGALGCFLGKYGPFAPLPSLCSSHSIYVATINEGSPLR